jgi:hypothetical protein
MCRHSYMVGRGERPQGQAWADRVTHPWCGGGWQCFVQLPFPDPPHTWGLTEPVLGGQFLSQNYIPKSTNVTFGNTKMGFAMLLILSQSPVQLQGYHSGHISPAPRALIYPASGLLLGRPPLLSLFFHSP